MKEVKWFLESPWLFLVIGLACSLGLVMQFILVLLYRQLETASDNIVVTNNRVIKSMHLRLTTCMQLKLGLRNVDAFVERSLFRAKWLGIYLSTWNVIGGQIRCIATLAVTFAILLQIILKCGQVCVLSTLAGEVLMVGMWISFGRMTNIDYRRQRIHSTLVDYLENVVLTKYENEEKNPLEMEAYRNQYFESKQNADSNTLKKDTTDELEERLADGLASLSASDKQLVEEILQEYLV